MTVLEFIVLLLIAAVCGAIGQSIAGFSFGGLLTTIALGFIGALLGLAMARSLRLPEPLAFQVGDTTFPVIWSIIGSALFVALIGFLRRAPRETV